MSVYSMLVYSTGMPRIQYVHLQYVLVQYVFARLCTVPMSLYRSVGAWTYCTGCTVQGQLYTDILYTGHTVYGHTVDGHTVDGAYQYCIRAYCFYRLTVKFVFMTFFTNILTFSTIEDNLDSSV